MKKIAGNSWKKHKTLCINSAQLIAILSLIAGVANNYLENKRATQWIGDNLGQKTSLISNMSKEIDRLNRELKEIQEEPKG